MDPILEAAINKPNVAGRWTEELEHLGNVREFDSVESVNTGLGADGRRESVPEHAIVRKGRVVAPDGCGTASLEVSNPRYRRARSGELVIENGDSGPSIPWCIDWYVRPQRDRFVEWPLKRLLKLPGDQVASAATRVRLLAAAETYQRLYDSVQSDGNLRGTDLGDDLYRVDQRTWVNPATGETEYKGTRRVKSGDHSTPPRQNGKPATKVWKGDEPLLGKIGAARTIERLTAALGPLLQPTEAAVCQNMTMGAIGEREGFSNKYAEQVGKAFVLRGLHVVAAELDVMDAVTGSEPHAYATTSGRRMRRDRRFKRGSAEIELPVASLAFNSCSARAISAVATASLALQAATVVVVATLRKSLMRPALMRAGLMPVLWRVSLR